ncbi:glycosyltransferase family 2 protein [Microlunatus flavus]|uniref:Cellulose synthase (UDP-forming) n=1 Tax=Microlunatus flavus TaxID=1036181 RepID=A0A1H9CQ31_9ACTN|nr:cellulose synthase catalytic subunit [Microlunatus flavus]SEQ03305.1 cellulose synthase (UDP-forming) [Microlunatus flavus]
MARPVHDYARVDEYEPVSRRAETANPYPPVLIVITLVATLGIIRYAMFLLSPGNRGSLLPYLLVVVAELILIVHALLSGWTILTGTKGPRDFPYHEAKTGLFNRSLVKAAGLQDSPEQWPMSIDGREVSVDVFIPVYGEDVGVIRRTALAALAIRGRHRTFVLDDGRSDEVRAMAAEIGCGYIRRLSGGGAKAGNINHALSIVQSDYFCVFDADFVPRPEFLVETVPFFVDKTVAFVQTPQAYGNLHNLISRGAGYMQTVFYKFVQTGRNHFNAAFCVGTNVIYRRAAVDDVGGIYTDSKSEDVWTSLMLHERGWRTIYIPQTLAVGDAPETIEAYTKQQLRWATGGFEIMFTHNPLSPRHKLSMDQRLMYLVTATHYLTGLAPGLLLLVPPLEIYFDLRPVNLDISITTWVVYYAGFYLMQILLAFYTLGSFRWEVLMLAAVSFPIYLAALVNAFVGKEQKWHVTGGKGGRPESPFSFIIPQVCVFAFLALTSVVAVWRDVDNSQLTLATGWNVTNTAILGVFMLVALRESWRNRHPAADRAADPAPGWTVPQDTPLPVLPALPDGTTVPADSRDLLVGAGSTLSRKVDA